MRILYLSQLIPYPADAGPKVRIYHVLQYLAAAGHEVTLVAFRREDDTMEAIDHLRAFCTEVHTVLMSRSRARDAWELARSTVTGRPFLIGRDGIANMNQLVQDLVAQPTIRRDPRRPALDGPVCFAGQKSQCAE